MIKRHTFENGFQVVYQKSEQSIPLTCIYVFCNVGSAFEINGIRGASHLVEHMCFKGTHSLIKARNLLVEYNKIGASFNAYTEKRVTAYTLTCDNNHVQHCTTLLSDMLLHSSFPRKEFAKEQHVVVEENIKTNDKYEYMLEKALDIQYFRGSSYEHPIDIIDYHPSPTYLKYEDIL
jgi:predicted Zn-dependent peptidase